MTGEAVRPAFFIAKLLREIAAVKCEAFLKFIRIPFACDSRRTGLIEVDWPSIRLYAVHAVRCMVDRDVDVTERARLGGQPWNECSNSVNGMQGYLSGRILQISRVVSLLADTKISAVGENARQLAPCQVTRGTRAGPADATSPPAGLSCPGPRPRSIRSPRPEQARVVIGLGILVERQRSVDFPCSPDPQICTFRRPCPQRQGILPFGDRRRVSEPRYLPTSLPVAVS